MNPLETLKGALLAGPSGALERLATELVSGVSGLPVRRAVSGSQSGADAGGANALRAIRLEAKRYKDATAISEREVLGEVAQALRKDPCLEAWILVTTREAPEQIVSAVREFGEAHGVPILILDWSGTTPVLAMLCAALPTLVRGAYGEEAAAAAEAIAAVTDPRPAVEMLRRDLDEWAAGWALVAKRCRNMIRETLRQRAECKAYFRQDLAVAAPDAHCISRSHLLDRLNQQLTAAQPGQPLLVIGEEGRGKSWTLASWLLGHATDDAAMLYCSSSEFRSLGEYTVEKVLAHALSKRAGPFGPDYWAKRVERLKQIPIPTQPILWMVIDGLNEAPSADWRELFLHAQRDVWRTRIRFIASCRSRYFDEVLQRGRFLAPGPGVIDVPPFSNHERDDALRARGVDPSALSASVLELARTPRICRLIASMAERLVGLEHLTLERLLFEYGKRFDPDGRAGLTDEVWHAFLRELARATRAGAGITQRSRLREWVDVREGDADAALSDIVDGQLVRAMPGEPGLFEFDRQLVLAANGLALWNLLRRQSVEDTAQLSDLLARELEPLGGVDERAAILAAALAAAALSGEAEGTARPVVTALVVEGITSQNLASRVERHVLGHAPFFPQAYLNALATLARAGRHDEAELILRTVQDASAQPIVNKAIGEAASDWIRVVALELDDQVPKDDLQRHRSEQVIRWLGRIPAVGAIEVLGTPLVIETGKTPHQLPLYALRLIQCVPLAPLQHFWRRFAVARILDGSRSLSRHAAWIVRLNRKDYGETCGTLESEATWLLSQRPSDAADVNLSKRAAAGLLWLIEDASSEARARALVPEPEGWAAIQWQLENPAASLFQLKRSQVEIALQTSEQPVGRLLGRARPWLADPLLHIPHAFVQRTQRCVAAFDLKDYRSGQNATAVDVDLECWFPGLARCSAHELATLHRRLVAELKNRNGAAWAFLSHESADLWLIASNEDCAVALQELKRNDLILENEMREHLARVELRLLASAKSAPEQYPLDLIVAGIDRMTSATIAALPTLTPLQLERLISHVRECATDAADWILVNLLAHTSTEISHQAATYLLKLCGSAHPGTRLHALYALARAECGPVAREFADTGWSWRDVDSDAERRHGSDILMAATPPLPLDDLLARIAPWRWPAAAHRRGKTDEARTIAMAVTQLLSTTTDQPQHAFEERVELAPKSAHVVYEPLKLNERESEKMSLEDLGRIFDVDARLHARQEAEREAHRRIAAGRGQGLAFYGEWIEPEHLSFLLQAAPELLDQWLPPPADPALAAQIRNASGFYLALCQLVLQCDPSRGVSLWQLLIRAPHSTRFTDASGIDLKWIIAFEAPENDVTRALWNELWDLPGTATDEALFELILAAESSGRSQWLEERVEQDMACGTPWRRARALFAAAFRLSPMIDRTALNRKPGIHTHWESLQERTATIATRAVWQRHWLQQYFRAPLPEDSMAALTMFLEVADARFPLIQRELSREGLMMTEDRLMYLAMRRSAIEQASKKFMNSLSNVFLGEQIERNIWPWSRDWTTAPQSTS
jgi:hypothetical protein